MADWTPHGQGPPSKRPGTRTLRAGVVLVVASIIVGVALVALAFLPLFSGSPQPIAGSTTLEAADGDRLVLYRLRGTDAPLDCTLVGPGEEQITLAEQLFPSTFTTNGTTYVSVADAIVQRTGRHVASCPGSDSFAIGPEVNIIRTVVLGFVGIAGGIVTFLVGIVLVVVGLVRRSSPPPGPPRWPQGAPPGPPGWQQGPPQWSGPSGS